MFIPYLSGRAYEAIMHHHPVNLVEFCAGYCGIGIGLKSVVRNLRTIAYVEREAYPAANLAAKIEAGRLDAAPIWSDLLDFPYGKFRGLVDIAAAGIPCQPHSHAGLRKGGGDERFLFGDWLRGLQQMRPRCILIENVEGLLTSQMPDGTLCIRWTLERLERMGYRTASGIFSAEECGAPHIRKRVWILAYADSERGQGSECFLRDACEIGQGREDSAADSDIGDAWKWPSGPDEPQRWWEPSRTLESSMGRKPARSAIVLDRLRLLGNGVVPATAALAFRTLARELFV
jgi:DNA (cytosine-5)-methyltransferase 1